MSKLQSHRPDDLVLRSPCVGAVFKPGHTVAHADDAASEGMVLSRHVEDDRVVCEVLWSQEPAGAQRRGGVVAAVKEPVPTRAVWKRNTNVELVGRDRTLSDMDNNVVVTYDGEEEYDPSLLSNDDINALTLQTDACRSSTTWQVNSDGSGTCLHVQRQGVPEHWIPGYVRNMQGETGRFRDGRQV